MPRSSRGSKPRGSARLVRLVLSCTTLSAHSPPWASQRHRRAQPLPHRSQSPWSAPVRAPVRRNTKASQGSSRRGSTHRTPWAVSTATRSSASWRTTRPAHRTAAIQAALSKGAIGLASVGALFFTGAMPEQAGVPVPGCRRTVRSGASSPTPTCSPLTPEVSKRSTRSTRTSANSPCPTVATSWPGTATASHPRQPFGDRHRPLGHSRRGQAGRPRHLRPVRQPQNPKTPKPLNIMKIANTNFTR